MPAGMPPINAATIAREAIRSIGAAEVVDAQAAAKTPPLLAEATIKISDRLSREADTGPRVTALAMEEMPKAPSRGEPSKLTIPGAPSSGWSLA